MLTQMSKFWFDMTRDIIPNHMISVEGKDLPEFFRTPEFAYKSMLCRKLEMLPVECIVRGLYHRQRLGQLPEGRHRLRHHPARRPEGERQAARAYLHPQHQGGDRRPRREHLL